MPDKLLNQLPSFIQGHQLATIPTGSNDPADDDYSSHHVRVEDIKKADIITSHEPGSDLHRPVLDIDFPVAVIPSSTPGHFHLYIDKPMPWAKYARLLEELARAGVIEERYASVSTARKYTSVRLPWVKKQSKKES